MKKICLCFLMDFFFLVVSGYSGPFVREREDSFLISTQSVELELMKKNGQFGSAYLAGGDWSLESDYRDYDLFYSEFAVQYHDQPYEIFANPSEMTLNGSVSLVDTYITEDFAHIQYLWENDNIATSWSYDFYRDQDYFVLNLERTVLKSWVFSNHQQCIMLNPEFDNFYLVNYENDWFCMMHESNWGPYAKDGDTISEHTIFTAIDAGLGVRYPAFGWYHTPTNTTVGVLVTSVSPNQRAVFAYHGATRTKNPPHPGYAEAQWDWFGKSDTEAIYLKKGTEYSLQFVYYFKNGHIDSLDVFNRKLFNETCYDQRLYENYSVASWGTRHAGSPQYSWLFPQASSNYICSQELFLSRSVGIPHSQNGTTTPHLFEWLVLAEKRGNSIDLSPQPTEKYQLPLQDSVSIEEGAGWMKGGVHWTVASLKNSIYFKMAENSKKLIISGTVSPTQTTSVEEIYIDLPFSQRVSEAVEIDSMVWDVRSQDTVLEQIGIVLYDMQGIQRVQKTAKGLKFVLADLGFDGVATPGMDWSYSVSLLPYQGKSFHTVNEIISHEAVSDDYFRDYYQTFSDLNFSNEYGMRADNRISIRKVFETDENDFFHIAGYAEAGNYSMYLFTPENVPQAVSCNGDLVDATAWTYEDGSGRLQVPLTGAGEFELVLYRDRNGLNVPAPNAPVALNFELFSAYPNPFNSETAITISISRLSTVLLQVFNAKGQLVATVHDAPLDGGQHSFFWNAADQQSGCYLIRLGVENKVKTIKCMLLK